ncbi:MAG: hypothetical protein IIZ78_16650 [Clostridiales bacterium]|nr:hypothetical protein [Clostridiales bacterium]
MAKRKEIEPKRRIDRLIAIIRKDGRNPIRLESWRYYSILSELKWFGVDHITATEVAKWCGRTHEEMKMAVNKYVTVELKEDTNEHNKAKEETLQ